MKRQPKKPIGTPGERLKRCPLPPNTLSDGARREWLKLAKVAHHLGTLTAADLRGFELLCETLTTERTAREAVAAAGMTTKTADGGLKPHPGVRIMETARNQAARLLESFGLNPKGRGSVERAPAKGVGATNDKWKGVL